MILKHICRKERATNNKMLNYLFSNALAVVGDEDDRWGMAILESESTSVWICAKQIAKEEEDEEEAPLLWTLVLNGYQEVSRSGGSNKLFANIYGQFHCFTFRCRTSNRLLLNHWQTNGQQDRGRASSGLDIILRSLVVDLQTSRYEHAKIFQFEFHFPQESSWRCIANERTNSPTDPEANISVGASATKRLS